MCGKHGRKLNLTKLVEVNYSSLLVFETKRNNRGRSSKRLYAKIELLNECQKLRASVLLNRFTNRCTYTSMEKRVCTVTIITASNNLKNV